MRVVFILGLLLMVNAVRAQRLTNQALQAVNSPYDELNPVLSADGKTLYVTLANHPQNVGGKKDPGDIWVAVLTETGQWSAPIHAGTEINDRAYNAVAGFSADGQQMFLMNHYDASGTAHTQGISVSKNNGGGWSRPTNITIPYFQNKSAFVSGYILPDQSVFVYSAETYGTRGVEDIYVTVRGGDGRWSEPKNLGGVINTQFQEVSPSLSADGKTLYFSSNGRKGYGSFDIYASTRLDDSWTQWSAPVNMGTTYNSEGREQFFRDYLATAGIALYASTLNSDGYADIKIFVSSDPLPKKDSVVSKDSTILAVRYIPDTVKIVEVNRAPDNKKVRVYGKVTNTKTGEAITATITFAAPSSRENTSATVANGYAVVISSTEDYTVSIEATGYVSAMEKLDIHTYEMAALEMNFKLQPVEIGTTVNLKDVLFEQGKTNLLAQSYPELDLVVSFLKANPKVKIELAGHTDNRGIPAQNVKLSQARVDKVKAYLVSKGIEGKRISGKGYGGAKPIASNEAEDTRQLNRRVEFTIRKF